MPTPRTQLVSLEATPYYHCISRCVRRAFLCGQDRFSGKSFDHRKQWLVERMKELAGIFAIDICAYGLMSNHFHVILRIERERALCWTDEEVAERYAKLFPCAGQQSRQLSEKARNAKLNSWRTRLWNLSWFMRCLNESIARRANREDDCTGRFWEGRFRSQALLDEGALLTCMSYVDLNPIRAGLATTLEDSAFTSIRERLLAAARGAAPDATALVPFANRAAEGRDTLPLPFGNYVALLRWTAAAIAGQRNREVPLEIGVSLEQLGLQRANFVGSIRHYSRRFFTMVGHAHRIDLESRRRGYRRRPGIRGAQQLYRATAA